MPSEPGGRKIIATSAGCGEGESVAGGRSMTEDKQFLWA